MIHHGDALEVMRTFDSESIDALVTDPPAGIHFMSKSWDHHKGGRDAWIEWMTEVMRECYRVLKPGAHAVVWALPRTSHWTATAIEDAGFEIRDRLAHVFASGFPKSHNLSGGLGTALKPAVEDWWLARKPLVGSVAANVSRYGTGAINIGATRIVNGDDTTTRHSSSSSYLTGEIGQVQPKQEPYTTGGTAGRWPSNLLLSDPELFDVTNPGVVGSGAVTASGQLGPNNVERHGHWSEREPWSPERDYGGDSGGYSRFFIIPKADRTDREPVLRGQLAERHAGIAIRQAEPGEYDEFVYPAPEGIGEWLRQHREAAGMSAKALCGAIGAHGAVNHGGAVSNWEQELNRPTPDQWRKLREVLGFDDRYDEVMTTIRPTDRKLMDGALPARRENAHPTVKPTDLMRHLVRLVTPSGGTVLDCFLGSGSTAIACELEGFPWIGIEKEAEYVAIAEARLNGVQRGLGLDVGAPVRKPPKTHPDLSKHQPKDGTAQSTWFTTPGLPEEAA